ncbi:DUF4270 family protein [Puteibacter caeruleilacunae]|nr:DUF4270 family protein [Puteibacter caeruleilacunae]
MIDKVRKIIYCILSVAIFYACEYGSGQDFSVGDDFVTDNSKVVEFDTMVVNLSTVWIDSIKTSNPSRLIVGRSSDPYVGTTEVSSYFEIGLSSGGYNLSAEQQEEIEDGDIIIDSLVLRMNYDGYYFGDTLQTQTFELHQLIDKLEEVENDNSGSEIDDLYNNTSFPFNPEPMGTVSFKPYPKDTVKNEIFIRLSDELGATLFDAIVEQDDLIKDPQDFREFMKGFVLRPGDMSGSVTGLRITEASYNKEMLDMDQPEDQKNPPEFRLYYHYKSLPQNVDPDDLFWWAFPMKKADAIYFTSFDEDFSTGLVSGIENTKKREISSKLTGNKTFIQGGNGLMTKLNIPGIERLKDMAEYPVFISAKLTIGPVPNTYEVGPLPGININPDSYKDKENLLPPTIGVYVIDNDNDFVQVYTGANNQPVVATLVVDDINKPSENETYYSLDLTPYFENEINDGVISRNSLALRFDNATEQGTVERLVLGDTDNAEAEVELKVTYFIY